MRVWMWISAKHMPILSNKGCSYHNWWWHTQHNHGTSLHSKRLFCHRSRANETMKKRAKFKRRPYFKCVDYESNINRHVHIEYRHVSCSYDTRTGFLHRKIATTTTKKYSSILYTLQSLSFIQSNCFECVNWNRIDCNGERRDFSSFRLNEVNRLDLCNLICSYAGQHTWYGPYFSRTILNENRQARMPTFYPYYITMRQQDYKFFLCAWAFRKCFDG